MHQNRRAVRTSQRNFPQGGDPVKYAQELAKRLGLGGAATLMQDLALKAQKAALGEDGREALFMTRDRARRVAAYWASGAGYLTRKLNAKANSTGRRS